MSNTSTKYITTNYSKDDKHNLLTAAFAFFTGFNDGAVTRAAFKKVRSGAVPGACSGPVPTVMRAGSMGPRRPTSLT